MSKTPAERRALKREGIKSYRVYLHAETALPMLVAEGVLAEADMGDEDAVSVAIASALASALSRRGARILKDRTTKLASPASVQTYKPQRRVKPRSGPGRSLSRKEIDELIKANGVSSYPHEHLPPAWDEPRRSGVSGRNVGVIPGPYPQSKPLPRSSDKKIKHPSKAQIKKWEKVSPNSGYVEPIGGPEIADRRKSPRVNTSHDWERDK